MEPQVSRETVDGRRRLALDGPASATIPGGGR